MYGDDEHAQHEMDRGRDEQDRLTHEREQALEDDYGYDEDVSYEGTEHPEFDS